MMPSEPHHNIFIVTGRVQGGKTTFLQELTDRLKEEINLAGFLSMGSFIGDQRSSFTLRNIQDGKQLVLATIEESEGWVPFGRFFFNPEALREGERIIRRGLVQRTDLVVLDEVGPFELQGGGWTGILELLEKEYEMAQIWVVREQILDQVLDRWNIPEKNVITTSPGEMERINQTIIWHVRNDEISPAT
jgi:nucleoside-triphosphatase THEP1